MIRNGNLQIDDSSIYLGYFTAQLITSMKNKHKLRVSKDDKILTYDLNNAGDPETFPLQLGDGKYKIELFKNVTNKKYSSSGLATISVKIKDQYQPYLYPNQYVDYDSYGDIMSVAITFSSDMDKQVIINNIEQYIVKNYTYDYVQAILRKKSLPDISGCFKKKMGICQDLAALMVSLLRLNQVPAKLIIGYYGSSYHAWVEAYNGIIWTKIDITAKITGSKVDKEYTIERWY